MEFVCYHCKATTDFANGDPELTFCETCCEGHNYEYVHEERAKFCSWCGKLSPENGGSK